jgi:hypothetical protein
MELQEAASRLRAWADGGLNDGVLAGFDKGVLVAKGYATVFMQGHGGRAPAHTRLWQTIQEIKATVVSEGREWTAGLKAGADGAVPYAAIQEFGGMTGPHEILPKAGKFLAFDVAGKTVFARKVNHPGSKIPGLHYLGGAIEQALPIMREEIGRTLVDSFEVALGG